MGHTRNMVEGISAFVRADSEEAAVREARRRHNARYIAVGKVLYIEDFGDGSYEVVLQRLFHQRVKDQYATAGTEAPRHIGYKQVPA